MLAPLPWEQVETAMATLDVGRGQPRRLVEVMALYVTGLILLEKAQTGVRIATVLPGRAHDALNRLLWILPWSPHQLILGLVRWVQRQTGPGLSVPGRRRRRETLRQTAHLGGVGVLAQQTGTGLWLPRRLGVLVQYQTAHSRRLSPVADEAGRHGTLSIQVLYLPASTAPPIPVSAREVDVAIPRTVTHICGQDSNLLHKTGTYSHSVN
jgi:hypothetical protein